MKNGGEGVPAFGLEPKFASQISIGLCPSGVRFAHCHPDDLGKFFSQTLLGFESARKEYRSFWRQKM